MCFNTCAWSAKLTLLHLGDQLLVEQAAGLLVKWAVDGDDVALSKHLLEVLDTAAADLLLLLSGQRLVVEVQEFLAVEGLEPSEDTLADTANGNGTDDLALEVVLVLSNLGDVPVAVLDLLVCGNEVADEGEDGHDDVLGDRDDVGSSNLCNGDTTVGLVGSIEVNMVGTDTSSDSELEFLGLSETFCGKVTRVETGT